MTVISTFDQLVQQLKKLPGLGYRSAERVALYLLVEQPDQTGPLLEALKRASEEVIPCPECGNLSEGGPCEICGDPRRTMRQLCVVQQVPDLRSLERSGAYRGRYHVLNGKLSPLHGIGPEKLNLAGLEKRLCDPELEELILALPNDIESEATCHYITESYPLPEGVRITRIGFGLPSGGGLNFADTVTVRSALEGRREYK